MRSWSPEEAAAICDEAVLVVENDAAWSVVDKEFVAGLRHRKQTLEGLSDSGVLFGVGDEREDGHAATRERREGPIRQRSSSSDGRMQRFRPRLHLLESPETLCPEQERRLRCANLEVPAGLKDLNSDDSDDEGDGFEFAKAEGTVASCDNSEQFAGSLSRPSIEVSISSSMSENWEGSSISRPELEVLIPTDYPPKGADSSARSVQNTISVSNLSSSSTGSSPCDQLAPILEKFPSDSLDRSFRDSSLSDDSLFSPPPPTSGFSRGFPACSMLACSSLSVSSACSDSTANYSPRNESVGDESGRIEELPATSPTIGWTNPAIEDKWDQLSPAVASWAASSPSDSVIDNWFPPDSPIVAQWGPLIPGLPNDLAQMCLMRVPFVKYDPSLRMVCKQWRQVLSSEEFFKMRKAFGIREAHISFVVHGNRVQVFSLQTCRWFCLPPLPRGDGNISPGWRVSPQSGLSSDGGFSPELGLSSDWGIDPYDWWQIDTVAVSDGTLFVIGGDQAELHSFTRPSKPTNRVHKYDFCKNRWVTVTPMHVPRSHAAAVSLGKLIYVAGGSEDREEGASAEVYDFEQNLWNAVPSMNTSMRMCVGMEQKGCFFVKGENTGPGSRVEGEIYNPARGEWDMMTSGMRRGLERGPIASSNANLFVADWKDSLLKMYDPEQDSWSVIAELPARISRLVGHCDRLYGLTGKIKVDPFNHHVISDAPAEVWRLDLTRGIVNRCRKTVVSDLAQSELQGWKRSLQADRQLMPLQRERGSGLLTEFMNESDNGVFENPLMHTRGDYEWECVWRDPKQMVKTGGLAWVPCIAHCTLFED